MNAIEVEEKSCSLTHRTFSPDTTTVSMDNSLYSGQSDAGPRKLLVQVEALEGTEEPVGISHIESTTVIAYKIFSRFIGRMCHPELDSGAIHRACELPGIRDQIIQDDA